MHHSLASTATYDTAAVRKFLVIGVVSEVPDL
jgi:hypothetical protein